MRTTCCLCDVHMSEHDAHLLIDSDGLKWLESHCLRLLAKHPFHVIHKFHSLSEDSYQAYLRRFR